VTSAGDISAGLMPDVSPDAAAMVRARDLFKIYKEGTTETVALRGASLELNRGDMASLVGPSGSGKSTLLWIMAGLSLPSAGQMFVGGQDLARLDETERARVRAKTVGVIFQRGNLIPFLTAHENVVLAVGSGARGVSASTRARAILTELGLSQRLHHYPRQLSGGEAQRVGIAVALANEPALLLGDEVTGELDSGTSEQVMDLLMMLHRERNLTMLLVTHNATVAATASRQLTIVDGAVAEQ
jgi:putative ABC transport system ATP-binding protein